MISETKLKIKSVYNNYWDLNYQYKPPTCGSFYTYNSNTQRRGSKETCRESFAYNFRNTTKYVGFYAANISKKIKYISAFFEYIEKKLQLPIKTTCFLVENESDHIILSVSPFWSENSFKRGMFTLFLRCAALYYKGDFDVALEKYDLTKKIIPVIKFFLDGHTQITKPIKGVIRTFSKYKYDRHTRDWSHKPTLIPNYKEYLTLAKN